MQATYPAAAEHAVAADRFAREIVGFLTPFGGALAAAERQSVGPATIEAVSFECQRTLIYAVYSELSEHTIIVA